MKRGMILAFALGALVDHVLYRKTHALREQNIAARRESSSAKRALALTPDLPTTAARAQERNIPHISPDFSDRLFADDIIRPGLFLDKNFADRSAMDLARQFAEKWGYTSSDLSAHDDAKTTTSMQSIWDFSQVLDGYEVYGSGMRIIALNDSGEVLLVNNGMHPINSFTPKINYGLAQSQSVLETAFRDYPVSVHLKSEDPVVWPSRSAELAWIFIVHAKDNSDTLRVAIGANSGKILMSESARETAAPVPIRISANFDADCMVRRDLKTNEACLFYKNPTFSARQESNRHSIVFFGGPPYYWHTAADGSTFQHQRVLLRDLDTSGYLQNNLLSVIPGLSSVPRPRAQKDGSWRYPYAVCVGAYCVEDPKRQYAQVNAYYWANELRHFMRDRSGDFYADAYAGVGKTVIISSQESATSGSYYVPELRRVNLFVRLLSQGKTKKWKEEDAVLAEQVMHEYGHANFSAATKIASNDYVPTTIMSQYACKTSAGCILAINEGVAFLHSALPFDAPRIYESSTDTGDGEFNLTTAEYYNLDANSFYARTYPKGEAHTMGLLYASIWWNVRSNLCGNFSLENDPESRKLKIDRLFTQYLPWLRLSDTIPTAFAKVAALARSLPGYGEQYARAFERELDRRYKNPVKCSPSL